MSSKLTRISANIVLVVLIAAVGVHCIVLCGFHVQLEQPTAAFEKRARVDDPKQGAFQPDDLSNQFSRSALDDPGRDPCHELEHMRSRIDELFGDSLDRFALDSSFTELSMSRFDLKEHDEEYVVRLDIPGSDEASFDVSLEGRALTIGGDREEEVWEEKADGLVLRERHFGRFERRLALPGPVDPVTLTEEYAGGVLTVRVHKA